MAAKHLFRYEPDYATPPGEVLESHLAARGMTKAELASRCGRPMKTISEIIHGKAAITAETALQLERVLGTPASLWQNLEATYRLRLAEQGESGSLASHSSWAKKFPIRVLVERGCIEEPTSDADLVKKLMRFFGVGTLAGWDANFGQAQVAYRRSPAFKAAPECITTWIRLGEIEGGAMETAPFDKARFRAALIECRALTAKSFPAVQAKLVELCASAGVAVVFVPELPKTHVSGIARWLTKDKALIQLSLRYKTADHLWFTFFHEAAHILLHGKKEVFIDENGADVTAVEQEANHFASEWLIPGAAFASFVAARDYSAVAVKRFAARQGIAPGIVVGRLQHEKRIPFAFLNDLKERLTWG